MNPMFTVLIVGLTVALTACDSGNVTSARDFDAPKAPPVRQPLYDPNAAYGSANATWVPPIYNRHGTIVHPADPNVDASRPPYEQAPWATGAEGGNTLAPPGTF